jgi:hypothetical protein
MSTDLVNCDCKWRDKIDASSSHMMDGLQVDGYQDSYFLKSRRWWIWCYSDIKPDDAMMISQESLSSLDLEVAPHPTPPPVLASLQHCQWWRRWRRRRVDLGLLHAQIGEEDVSFSAKTIVFSLLFGIRLLHRALLLLVYTTAESPLPTYNNNKTIFLRIS